ncbi:hypothetical protein [Mycobacterium sp. AT1]|nr:hypothetical protein [Mycobacterium sp. AT1]
MNSRLKFIAAVAIVVLTTGLPLAPPNDASSASPTAPNIHCRQP